MIKKKESGYKKVKALALNVRSSPTLNSLIVTVLPRGTVVKCDPEFKDKIWDHIVADPDITGFCMKEFLEDIPEDEKPHLILDTITIKKPAKEEIKDDKEDED